MRPRAAAGELDARPGPEDCRRRPRGMYIAESPQLEIAVLQRSDRLPLINVIRDKVPLK